MAANISDEIESKTKSELTEEEFETILKFFDVEKFTFVQTIDHYFIDDRGKLKELAKKEQILLYVEQKEKYTLKLDLPSDNRLRSCKNLLDTEAFLELQDSGTLTEDSNVGLTLLTMSISGPFTLWGTIETHRTQIRLNLPNEWQRSKIFLSLATFPGGNTYYELEVESANTGYSEQVRDEVLKQFCFPVRSTKSKAKRFIEELEKYE